MSRLLALFVLGWVLVVSQVAGGEETRRTHANVMVEMALEAKGEQKDPFNEVTLDAIFTDPLGKQLRAVPGFWAGGRCGR